MQTLLWYEPIDTPPTHLDDLESALALPGVELEGRAGDAYRAGRWRDPATGAWCHVDLGEPPLEADDLHPPTRYVGWRELPLVLQAPLTGAHWRAVEIGAFAQRLLDRLPGARVLDTEDTRLDADAEPGPFPLARPRLLASWERLHAAHVAGRSPPTPHMDRRASIALWRYRRERAEGRRAHPDLVWPEALALVDGDVARSAAVWSDPAAGFALPPVELVVVRRADGAGVLPADEVATAGAGERLPAGQALRLPPGDRLADLFRRARLLPVERFRALDDEDWTD